MTGQAPSGRRYDQNPTVHGGDPAAYARYAQRLDEMVPGWWNDDLTGMAPGLASEARLRLVAQAGFVAFEPTAEQLADHLAVLLAARAADHGDEPADPSWWRDVAAVLVDPGGPLVAIAEELHRLHQTTAGTPNVSTCRRMVAGRWRDLCSAAPAYAEVALRRLAAAVAEEITATGRERDRVAGWLAGSPDNGQEETL